MVIFPNPSTDMSSDGIYRNEFHTAWNAMDFSMVLDPFYVNVDFIATRDRSLTIFLEPSRFNLKASKT